MENQNSTGDEQPDPQAESQGEVLQGDFSKLMSDRMAEQQQQIQEIMVKAAEQLGSRLKDDKELERTAYMILSGYRLIQWAALHASSMSGITMPMVRILVQAQERAAQQNFDLAAFIEDFDKNQMPWLESQRKQAVMEKTYRERRMRELSGRLRRKDIQLPFHSMVSAAGDDGFTHDKTIFLIGPSETVRSVIRLCTREYQRAGGSAALLTTDASEAAAHNKNTAQIMLPPDRWRNCADIYNSTLEVLKPITERAIRPIGMLAVDNLADMLVLSMPPISAENRLGAAAMTLIRYQSDHAVAMLVGIANDDYPVGVSPTDIHPWLNEYPHVQVALAESKLAGGSQNVVVGNDVLPLYQLMERLKDKQ